MNIYITIGMINECLKEKGFQFSFKGDLETRIYGFSSLFNYQTETLTFIVPERSFKDYIDKFTDKRIALIIKGYNEISHSCFDNIIVLEDPRKAFFTIVEEFFDTSNSELVTCISSNQEIYRKHSYIAEGAVIGNNVQIGVGCVIEGNVVIGDNTELHHNVVIRKNTRIGQNCTIFSGTVIGERGFNFTVDENGVRHMIKHYGGVVIEDDVHIGDNCCIIQGAIDDTVIKRGVKINTMVHVAHNNVIGEDTVITSPVHICGSVTIGANCHIAANIIRNQVTIGDGAVLGLGAVVVKNVQAGETVFGNPAKPMAKK